MEGGQIVFFKTVRATHGIYLNFDILSKEMFMKEALKDKKWDETYRFGYVGGIALHINQMALSTFEKEFGVLLDGDIWPITKDQITELFGKDIGVLYGNRKEKKK